MRKLNVSIKGGFYRMKRRVTVRELKEYCEKSDFRQVSFYSENQDWYRSTDPCRLKMCFPIVQIFETPNMVGLKAEKNTLCFDRVRFAEIDTEASILGTVLTLYCGGPRPKDPKRAYRLIAS